MARPRRAWTPLAFILVLAAAAITTVLVKDWSPHLGLDLQGGVSVVYQASDDADIENVDEALDTTIEIIRSRVDALGVAEPEIVRQGGSIVVNLPGIEDREAALEVIGQTAELQFRPVLAAQPYFDAEALESLTSSTTTSTTAPADDATTTTAPADDDATTTTTPDTTVDTTEGALGTGVVEGENAGVLLPAQEGDATTTTTAAPADDATTTTTAAPADDETTTTTTAPPLDEAALQDPCILLGGTTPEEEQTPEATVVLPSKPVGDDAQRECYQLGPVPTDGQQSLVGSIVQDPQVNIVTGEWGVSLGIRGNALDLFNRIASSCYLQDASCPTGRLAIVLDEEVKSAPTIREPAFDSTGLRISGAFSEGEARDLALVLRYGALPIELVPQTVQEVSATLGEDSLRAGLIAGFIGVGLVVLYMLLYYRALGLVVVLGLGVWGALNYSIISWLGETQGLALSLAGVTGIVVSVGVTVDSYVVYFERLREDIRAGKTVRSSVDRSFQRAFRTILTADVSSFMGAALLYTLTVGPVRGFAFFLALSTMLDVVVAWFFTRPLVGLLGRREFFTRSKLFGVARGTAPAPVGSEVPA